MRQSGLYCSFTTAVHTWLATTHRVPGGDRKELRASGQPRGGASARLRLIRDGFSKKGMCELSFKGLLGPLPSPPPQLYQAPYCIPGPCQMCFLPQGLYTCYPFCLERSSLGIHVAALPLDSDVHLPVALSNGAPPRAVPPLLSNSGPRLYSVSYFGLFFFITLTGIDMFVRCLSLLLGCKLN